MLSAVSPENALGEMYVIKLLERRLHTESDWFHSNDECSNESATHKILAYHVATRTDCNDNYQSTNT